MNDIELRDWFAGQALSGLIGVTDVTACITLMKAAEKAGISVKVMIARTCYNQADAMLKARDK